MGRQVGSLALAGGRGKQRPGLLQNGIPHPVFHLKILPAVPRGAHVQTKGIPPHLGRRAGKGAHPARDSNRQTKPDQGRPPGQGAAARLTFSVLYHAAP